MKQLIQKNFYHSYTFKQSSHLLTYLSITKVNISPKTVSSSTDTNLVYYNEINNYYHALRRAFKLKIKT